MSNNKQKLELTWIGKDEQLKLEPRILIEDPEKSFGDKNTDNMLIYGDNLLALKALEQDFTGRIKCIYIDPPFNTGNAFELYDDSVEHSIWLTLMRNRILLLQKLLSDDGALIVHIDDIEQAYLKILLDEIFGRKYFVNNITVQDSHPSGLKLSSKDKTIIKTKSYMLVYKKTDKLRINSIYKKRDKWDTHFNTYLDVDNPLLTKENLKEVLIANNIINKNEKLNEDSLKNESFRDFCFRNRQKIFQSTKELPDEARKASLLQKDQVYKYVNDKGEVNYALNGRRLSPLAKSIKNVGIDKTDIEDFAKLLCDFWDDVDFNNSQNEGGVQFPASKKPEFLIARIFTMFTKEGDIILDSFLGSGTSAAVAHKMGRKWIGIELNEHCHTHCLPRLRSVVNGEDQSGISTLLNWQGGEGFRYYFLAPSLLKMDEHGNWIISQEYDAAKLAAAMAKNEGFKFQPDGTIYWKQGQSTEKDFIFTTTNFMTLEFLDKIHEQMQEDESLLICCKSFSKEVEDRYPNITIKKIPMMLLGRCEFDKDNYNLNIVNVPILEDTDEEELQDDEPENEQTSMFEGDDDE